MRADWSRLTKIAAPVKRVRPSLKFSCGRGTGLRQALSRIARSYRLVDEHGSPKDSEIVRVLLVTTLTADQPNRVATAVYYAVAAQRPMLAAELGRKIMKRYSTSELPNSYFTRGGRRTAEKRNRASVALGKWLRDSLEAFSVLYLDDMGVVHDTRMVADMCMRALADPALTDILNGYVEQTSRLRERLGQAETWIAQVVDEAMADAPARRAG